MFAFCFIELDDGKIYRKPLYLMVKTHGFPVDFPLNQSIDCCFIMFDHEMVLDRCPKWLHTPHDQPLKCGE